jgi:hypothetical protein
MYRIISYIKDCQTQIFIAKLNVYLYNKGRISKPMTQYTILPLLDMFSEFEELLLGVSCLPVKDNPVLLDRFL